MTGYSWFRVVPTTYAFAVCAFKEPKHHVISLHRDFGNANETKAFRIRSGFQATVIPVTPSIRIVNSTNARKPRQHTEQALMQTQPSYDGVSNGYNESSTGHSCRGIGNWYSVYIPNLN
jgi:hypothetical protein